MGLITKEVEVKLNSKNIEYYENLGYEIHRYYNENNRKWCVKRKSTLTVNINDLKENAMYNVQVSCDCCDKLLNIPFQRYNLNKRDEKYYCRKCAMKLFNSGSDNAAWNPNKTDEERLGDRHYNEYKIFTNKVLKRDHYTCFCCGHKGSPLEVHHLNGYNWCIEGRVDETNAVTLCETCHSNFHSIYGQGNNTKEQFEEWIGKSIGLLKKYDGKLPVGRQIICYETKEIYDNPPDAEAKTGFIAQRFIDCCNRKVRIHNGSSVKCITTNGGKHYFWLDEYENMNQDDFDKYFEWCKPPKIHNVHNSKKVICLETMEIFESITKASLKYSGTNIQNVSRCCKGITKHSGKLEDGTKLSWKYYDDYLDDLESTAS